MKKNKHNCWTATTDGASITNWMGTLGFPWTLLGTRWGQDTKHFEKVTSQTPPERSNGDVFLVFFDTLTVPFSVSFLGGIFRSFLEPIGTWQNHVVVCSLITSFKNRLWHFLKKYKKWYQKRLHFGTFWELIYIFLGYLNRAKTVVKKSHVSGLGTAREPALGSP